AAASWRAWNGADFSANAGYPYAGDAAPQQICAPVAPFVTPVGAVVRHRPSGAWIAVLMAKKDDVFFPQSGIWASASKDLLRWSAPTLIMPGATLYDDPCAAKGRIIAYPSLIDRNAHSRNFDDSGDEAELYFVEMRVEGCAIAHDRK